MIIESTDSHGALALTIRKGGEVHIQTPQGRVTLCVKRIRSREVAVVVVAPRGLRITRSAGSSAGPGAPATPAAPASRASHDADPPPRLHGVDDVPVVALDRDACERVREAARLREQSKPASDHGLPRPRTDINNAAGLNAAARGVRRLREMLGAGRVIDTAG